MEKQSPIPNAEKLGFQPLKIRYVVYSPSYGLFLGNDKEGRDQWSKSDPEFSDRAPTFEAGMRLGDVVKTLVPRLHSDRHRVPGGLARPTERLLFTERGRQRHASPVDLTC
jgi:hypothetical protein